MFADFVNLSIISGETAYSSNACIFPKSHSWDLEDVTHAPPEILHDAHPQS